MAMMAEPSHLFTKLSTRLTRLATPTHCGSSAAMVRNRRISGNTALYVGGVVALLNPEPLWIRHQACDFTSEHNDIAKRNAGGAV